MLMRTAVPAVHVCAGSREQTHLGVKSSLPKGFVFHGLTGLSGLHSLASDGYFHAREPMTFPQWGHRLLLLFSRSRTVASQTPPHARHLHLTRRFDPGLTLSGCACRCRPPRATPPPAPDSPRADRPDQGRFWSAGPDRPCIRWSGSYTGSDLDDVPPDTRRCSLLGRSREPRRDPFRPSSAPRALGGRQSFSA